MTQTADEPRTKPKAATTRPYIVLEEFVVENETLYRKAGEFIAGNAEDASAQALAKGKTDDIVAYVAIPAGNFNRKAPTVETKTVVKWA